MGKKERNQIKKLVKILEGWMKEDKEKEKQKALEEAREKKEMEPAKEEKDDEEQEDKEDEVDDQEEASSSESSLDPMKILMLRLLLNPLHSLSLSERKLIFFVINSYPIWSFLTF